MVRGKRTIVVFELKGIVLIFICIFNPVILTLIPITAAYFFESPCKNTNNCNPTNHTNFICWNAICVCDLSRKLVYDHSKNYCLRPPGGTCKSDEDCVQNAHCDSTTQLCVCSPPHFEETEHSECKAKFKCHCNDTVMCNETKFLQCVDGRCSCVSGHNLVYERKKDKCVVELGQKCELIDWMGVRMECESNAECIVNEDDKYKFYGVCRCKENYFSFFDTCERVVGSPCNETDESSCQDGLHLKCQRGQCQCVDDAIFDSNYKQCRLRIGSPCHPSLENQCVTNAKCTSPNETILKGKDTCECDDGYAKTSRDSCKAVYGNYCLVDSDCFGEGSWLECSKGICRCQLGKEYDEQRKTCVSIIGELCNSHLTHLNVEKVHCVQNALCIPDESDVSRCVCKHPFVQLNNSCVSGIGAPCHTTPDCSSTQPGMICSGEMCICKSTTIFESISKKCKIKSGEDCQQDGELECASNSHCSTYSLESVPESNKCICNKGFHSAPNGRCLLGYGAHCHQVNATCDESRTLTCINDTCGCEAPLTYNDSFDYCEIVKISAHSRSIQNSQANQMYSASGWIFNLVYFVFTYRTYNIQ